MRKAKQQLTLSQREAVAAVSARLDGKRHKPIHVVFEQWPLVYKVRNLENKVVTLESTVGVWLDMDWVEKIARRATTNKNRKAKQGGIHVELHTTRQL